MRADRFSRIFDILELLAGRGEGLTATEIGKHLELPISSTHNLLKRAVESDVLAVVDARRYAIGPRAVRLGIRIGDGLEQRAVARRHLQDLALACGQDVYLAVRVGRRVVYVDRIQGTQPVSVDIRLGQPLYLHATSVGKLFAAHDAELRERLMSEARTQLTTKTLTTREELETELASILELGVAASREEAIKDIVGLAVPVFDARGEIASAIHVSALRSHLDDERETDLIRLARSAAGAIERDLGRVA